MIVFQVWRGGWRTPGNVAWADTPSANPTPEHDTMSDCGLDPDQGGTAVPVYPTKGCEGRSDLVMCFGYGPEPPGSLRLPVKRLTPQA